MERADVIVVGGGPSGLIFSEIAARRGLNTILIDKWDPPNWRKACGGMITRRVLRRFKIELSEEAREIRGIFVSAPSGTFVQEFRGTICVNMSRSELVKQLVERAESAGVRILTPVRVRDVRANGERVKIFAEGLTVEGAVIVGADGANSIVRRKVLGYSLGRERMGFCIQYVMRMDESMIDKSIGDVNEFYYGRDVSPYGYAYIFPRKREVAVGVGALLAEVKEGLRGYLERFVSRDDVREKLKGARIVRLEGAHVPLCGFLENIVGYRCILIGDAAGTVSPITGEGLYYSMISAETGASAVVEAFDSGDFSPNFLRRKYVKRLKKAIGSDLVWGLRLMRFFRKRRGTAQSVGESSLAARREVAELIAGLRPYVHCILRALPSIILSSVRQHALKRKT